MAIDIRADVTCSLGTLISGSISDDYLQGSGLVKTRGSAEISGLVTPAVGTVVTFSYTKNGVTRNIPRKLRVLSSFADPFRRTTKVELGCKLTYLSDLKSSYVWTPFDDPNNTYTEEEANIITIPVSAYSVMNACLARLELTASSNPLTNNFSIYAFDFSRGYVQVLSDLLVSESYFGYLNYNEVLQVRSLDVDSEQGTVFTANDIIDIAPIGVGALPGEAVSVSYSTLKLKTVQITAPEQEPEEEEEEEPDPLTPVSAISSPGNWNTSRASSRHAVAVSYTSGDVQKTAIYNVLSTTTETTIYKTINTPEGQKRVVGSRIVTESTGDVTVAGAMVTAYLDAGLSWSNSNVSTTTTENYTYDGKGNEVYRVATTVGHTLYLYGSAGVPFAFSANNVVSRPDGTVPLSKVETYTTVNSNFIKTVTMTYGPWSQTIQGQQTIAEGRNNFTTSAQVQDYLNTLANSGLYLLDVSVSNQKTDITAEEAPWSADVINAQYANKDGEEAAADDDEEGTKLSTKTETSYRVESTSKVVHSIGSPTALRKTELSMPYAPDDYFARTYTVDENGDPVTVYYSSPSDAAYKAIKYGRVQNRLLLGNRSGMNIQVSADKLPAAPFAPMYVQANGLTALYRANANQWAFSSEGIACSTDALFWAAVGGTGTFWFPVAPGVTALPVEPPIVNGEMNPTTVVKPYNETVICLSVLRTQLFVTSFDYALSVLAIVPALSVRATLAVRRIRQVEPPAASLELAATAPVVSGGASALVPAAVVTLAAVAPAVSSGGSVSVPAAGVTIALLEPQSVGNAQTQLFAPIVDTALSAPLPVVSTGTSVAVPVSDIAAAALVPSGVGLQSDPYFSSVSLLLHLDGTNGSTTFTDSSSNAVTMTRGGNAQLSTAEKKFGTASVVWDGTGDYLATPNNSIFAFGTGSYTVEMWIYFGASANFAAALYIWANNGRNVSLSGGVLRFRTTGGSSLITGTTTIAKEQWYHVALTRSGNSARLFINGTQEGSTYTESFDATVGLIHFGSVYNGGTNNWPGYMDEIRVTKGVARYTANFTAPTAPFFDQ